MLKFDRRATAWILVMLLSLAWPSGFAAADEQPSRAFLDRIEELERVVRRQQDELDALREQAEYGESISSEIASDRSNYNPSRSWRQAYGLSDIAVDVHGFLDLDFVEAGPAGANDGDATFDLHHVNLFFDAILRPDLRSHVEVEFEHAFEEVEIDQAFLAWGMVDWLTFTAGRFYAPFGIERFAWYPPVNHLVSRPLAFREIVPGNFYQQGLMVSGEVGPSEEVRFTYELSLSNGLGELAVSDRRESRQSRDNNSNMALTGRLAAVLWPWAEVGISAHSQEFNSSGEDQDLLFLGVDAAARWRGLEFRGEYVYAELDRVGMADLDQAGWYTQLAYTHDVEGEFLQSATFVLRHDQLNLDRSAHGDDDRSRWSLGTALQIYDHFRIKGEYQVNREGGPSLDDDAFFASFALDF